MTANHENRFPHERSVSGGVILGLAAIMMLFVMNGWYDVGIHHECAGQLFSVGEDYSSDYGQYSIDVCGRLLELVIDHPSEAELHGWEALARQHEWAWAPTMIGSALIAVIVGGANWLTLRSRRRAPG
jgi:hypothetical protein